MSQNHDSLPYITGADLGAAEELLEEGFAPVEVRKLVAGDKKEIYVDGIIFPVASLGTVGVREAMKQHDDKQPLTSADLEVVPYENGRRS